MKRVGILTLYYKTYNYGAQLQSYALQKSISNLGYECEQIQFDWSNKETKSKYYASSIDILGFEEFYNLIPHSSKVYTSDNIHDCKTEYDIFVCGSDQIWGVNNSMPIYVLPQITLSFVPDDKLKIAYAASMGSAYVSPKIQEAIKPSLKRMDAISVREKSALDFIAELSQKDVVNTLDPTFLLEAEEWNKIARDVDIDEKYVLFYGMGKNPYGKELAKKVAKKYSAKVIELAYDSGEKYNPYNFLSLIKNAEFVVSNSFHATVFSIIYNKAFITYPVDFITTDLSKNIRIIDMLNLFDLEERFLFNEESIEFLEKEINYEEVNAKLHRYRESSLKFLYDNLSKTPQNSNSVISKDECCACTACINACPEKCISIEENKNGHRYAVVDFLQCVGCNTCREICPVNNKPTASNYKIRAFSLVAHNESICVGSSSGGAFYSIASEFIKNGGVVFGAEYSDDFKVVHSYCETVDDLSRFMGSKYVQSELGESYKYVETFLKKKRKVLFTGTPCQIYGLKKYLNFDYDNLFTIDLICHGAPEPALFRKYISEKNCKGDLCKISMRNKAMGAVRVSANKPLAFVTFCVRLDYVSHVDFIHVNDDHYFSLFLGNSYLKPSCYICNFKDINRISDITIGDFHGVNEVTKQPIETFKNGVSLILIQSDKGYQLLDSCKASVDLCEYTIEDAIRYNPMMLNCAKRPFMYDYMSTIFETSTIERLYYEQNNFKLYHKYQNICPY